MGNGLLEMLRVMGNMGGWVRGNLDWIEGVVFRGVVGRGVLKVGGGVRNMGMGMGFMGKECGGRR